MNSDFTSWDFFSDTTDEFLESFLAASPPALIPQDNDSVVLPYSLGHEGEPSSWSDQLPWLGPHANTGLSVGDFGLAASCEQIDQSQVSQSRGPTCQLSVFSHEKWAKAELPGSGTSQEYSISNGATRLGYAGGRRSEDVGSPSGKHKEIMEVSNEDGAVKILADEKKHEGSGKRQPSKKVRNLTDKRRRIKINEKIETLHKHLPYCSSKRDKASILSDAAECIKLLQQQLHALSMASGLSTIATLAFSATQCPQFRQVRQRLDEEYLPFGNGLQAMGRCSATCPPPPLSSLAHSLTPAASPPPLMQGLIAPPVQMPTVASWPHDLPFSYALPNLSQYQHMGMSIQEK